MSQIASTVETTGRSLSPVSRPALRLVKTNDLSREEWLTVRMKGIGSSDAAAAVGLNPYCSQLELWMVKTSRQHLLPQDDPNDEASPMYWGTLLEPIVAAHYTKRTGNKVRRVNAVLQHPDQPWMLANIDREVVGCDDVQILECKTAGLNGARLWKDGVPEYIQLQVMHQLAVTGKQAADVAVLICGQELQVHRIERNEAMIAQLMALEQQFWEMVTSDQQPDADGSDSADLALRCLYPKDAGNTVDWKADPSMSALFGDLLDIRTQLSKYQEQESQIKQSIQQAMGHASVAKFETGSVSWKKAKESSSLDTKKLTQDHPDLVATYSQTKAGSRRFLVQAKE
ncbi:YqaJ viral recombinase family protein [Lampropedia aestuarii]|uniref:YqaJ viral recombinase family nuclease n=1 Tax=Lampropedia aestuarii TaxID=2562762 RepID=UPI00246930EB|nr:YqaJ viral recombinase family protein [Lampropedia aestuarii]MDH5858552.1 YqaJ viral recombinase family protein [Lampropedia aestuarii]